MYNNLIIRFGKYKGTMLQDIPDNYLIWLYNNDIKGKIKLHIQYRFNMPKLYFNVKEINTNQIFKIQAYNEKDAFRIASNKMGIYPSIKEFTIITNK